MVSRLAEMMGDSVMAGLKNQTSHSGSPADQQYGIAPSTHQNDQPITPNIIPCHHHQNLTFNIPQSHPESENSKSAPKHNLANVTDRTNRDEVNFATQLPHQFDLVSTQVETGMRVLKRMRSFFQKYRKIQETFALELQKAASYERAKLEAIKDPDQMSSCWQACIGVFDTIEEFSAATLDIAGDSAFLTVVQPLDQFHNIGLTHGKENRDEMNRIKDSLSQVQQSIEKSREACQKQLNALAFVKAQQLGKLSGNKGDGGKRKSVLSKAFTKKDPTKIVEKKREKAYQACSQYQSTLSHANHHNQQVRSKEIPHVLTEMQSLEEMRLQSLNKALFQFCALNEQLSSRYSTITSSLKERVGIFDSPKDLKTFVDRAVRLHGPPAPPRPFEYDMTMSPDDLKPENYNLDLTRHTLFHSTLDGVMQFQKLRCPSISCDLPVIVPALTKAIIDKGGLKEQGIFRVAPASQDITTAIRKLESGSIAVDGDNPHVPAALLKTWLRDLAEPLFPFSLYEKCISVGAEADKYLPATASKATGLQSLQPKFQEVCSSLDPLNRRVLCYLLEFLQKVILPENVGANKMTAHNLAIVFAPNLVRPPDTFEESSRDIMTKIKQSGDAIAFVEALIRTAISFPSEDVDVVRRCSLDFQTPPTVAAGHSQAEGTMELSLGHRPTRVSSESFQTHNSPPMLPKHSKSASMPNLFAPQQAAADAAPRISAPRLYPPPF